MKSIFNKQPTTVSALPACANAALGSHLVQRGEPKGYEPYQIFQKIGTPVKIAALSDSVRDSVFGKVCGSILDWYQHHYYFSGMAWLGDWTIAIWPDAALGYRCLRFAMSKSPVSWALLKDR